MDTKIAEAHALQLIGEFCPEFSFKWLEESKRLFGQCDHTKSLICLSRQLTELNSESQVNDTILHEIAHALAGVGHGHDKVWKAICIKIGARPERCYRSSEVIKPIAKYQTLCKKCGKESTAHRRRKRIACGKCCKKFNKGKWSKKYILKFIKIPKESVIDYCI